MAITNTSLKRNSLYCAAIAAAFALGAAVAVGCGGDDSTGESDPDPETKISGAIQVAGAGSIAAAGTPLTIVPAANHAPNAHTASARDFVPGQIIVKFRSSTQYKAMSRLRVAGVDRDIDFERIRPAALPAVALYRASNATRTETLAAIRQLEKRPDVAYAQPNYRVYPMRIPNDEFFSLQWHYEAIDLRDAWDDTIGSADTVVGVVDSGILFDSNDSSQRHPDFNGKVLPGFDFISDPQVAGDGDGRDSNPFDEGTPGQQSSYHGSHVAGTIGAATGDEAGVVGIGVAGVDWLAKILPVRTLGDSGGSLIDVYDGMLWAAGVSVSGVPDNPNPADVINMSLGGPSSCSPFEQGSIDIALAMGTIIVVAAGNDNSNADGFSPASCSGVITVGATGFQDDRAPYSNFGSRIDVMAPGGDLSTKLNNGINPDGVLSLGKDDGSGAFNFRFLQGTSMAAPHVAGVVSLMKAVKPDLTASEAVTLLRNTAQPLTPALCKRDQAFDCGAGLINARLAVGVANGDPIPGARVLFGPDPADLGSIRSEITVTLSNPGDVAIDWKIGNAVEFPNNPVDTPDGTLFIPSGADTMGSVPAKGTATTRIGVKRDSASASGTYTYLLEFFIDDDPQPETLLVRFSTVPASFGQPQGPMIVATLVETSPGDYEVTGSQVTTGFSASYEFTIEQPGKTWVVAWSDDNDNQEIDNGDFLGAYPEILQIEGGKSTTGIDFEISRVLDNTAFAESAHSALRRHISGNN